MSGTPGAVYGCFGAYTSGPRAGSTCIELARYSVWPERSDPVTGRIRVCGRHLQAGIRAASTPGRPAVLVQPDREEES